MPVRYGDMPNFTPPRTAEALPLGIGVRTGTPGKRTVRIGAVDGADYARGGGMPIIYCSVNAYACS